LPVILMNGGIWLAAWTCLAVYFPQRVAGPVFRLEQDLAEVAWGDFGKTLRLRSDGRFHSLADAGNFATGRVCDEFRRISRGLDAFEMSPETGATEQARGRLAEIRQALGGLKF